MATIDQQFVEYIVKTLVNNPDKVSVERIIDEKGVLLSLTVDSEDIGRVIGKRGATAQSIRTLLRALGTKNDARYNLKIVNTDGPASRSEASVEEAVSNKSDTTKSKSSISDDSKNDATTVSDSSDLAEKTRAELADLDDLDI